MPKSAAKTSDKKTRRTKAKTDNFNVYTHRVLKRDHPNMTITKKAMAIMKSLQFDILDRLVDEARRLNQQSKRKTIQDRDFQSAVRMIFPGELAKHAYSEGTKAVVTYKKA